MESSEQRRRELLQQGKRMRTSDMIPLVRTGNKCYSKENVVPEADENNGSFVMRIAIAVLGIVCFIWFDTSNASCFSVNSQSLVQQIEHENGISLSTIEHLISK